MIIKGSLVKVNPQSAVYKVTSINVWGIASIGPAPNHPQGAKYDRIYGIDVDRLIEVEQ